MGYKCLEKGLLHGSLQAAWSGGSEVFALGLRKAFEKGHLTDSQKGYCQAATSSKRDTVRICKGSYGSRV